MCGICGILNLTASPPVDENILLRMTECIAHRGPDEQGIYCQPMVGLGSRRLSIIDLAGGKQPITNETGSMWIVFNGEIYNYKELRLFLERKGHQFRTQTDTETILHLYEELGLESIQHLSGIFAFTIWDATKQEAIIARDQTGIKPLYYTQTNNQLIFGSELKVLLANPHIQREIDLVSLNEYLTFEYVPSPRTILRNIYRLEPGHYLQYNSNGLHIKQYWNVSFARSESRPPVNWRDYTEGLYDTLNQAVRQELVSDVPVGVLLSGGLDSSTIAALMVELYPGTVESFSIGFEEASFDESGYARTVANHLGTKHNELILTSKMAAEMVPSITDEFLDEPFGDSSLIPTYLLSKFARKKVKVVLGGDGSDELFAGYPTLAAHRLIEYYERLVPWYIRANIAPRTLDVLPVSFNNISFDFRMRRFLAGRGVPLQARHHRWLGSFIDAEKADLLQDWLKPVLRNTYTQAYLHAKECDARLPLNQILYNDMKMYLENDILYKVDRASMAASLEVRVPFLNRKVINFATSLPIGLKLHRLTGKYILKKAMAHAIPSKIINRPKKGFNMPVAQWLTSELRELTLDMLSESRIEKQELFKYGYVKQLLDQHFSHKRDNRKLLWTLLIFQLWHNKYIK
ncbi:asparagine synthase (glutamine-hydrolyzing) [Anaerolineales bacterium HSG25]|nr:asparagine synthase (glutamine-hydrolyzing) [Anaerolineales bacterium HSG25]